MERSKYNRSGGGAGRCRDDWRSVSVGGRDGYGFGRGGSGERGGNHPYQKYHQGSYQNGGGDGGRRGGRGRRDGPVQGGEGRSQMGTNPPPAQPWGHRPAPASQGRIQRPQSGMGQGAGATGARWAWSGGPPHVAGRGSSAPAVGGGAGSGAGEAPRIIKYLYLLLSLFLFIMLLPLLPIGDEWRCSLLLQHHHLRLHWTISCKTNISTANNDNDISSTRQSL